jgi:hypothetical protein
MPSPAVDAAFKARIEANFTTIPFIGLNGRTEPPSDGSSFGVIQYPAVNGDKPSLGRRFFEDGAARIVVNVEKGPAEYDAAQTWLPALASLFRDKSAKDLNVAGLQTFTPAGPITNDANDDGNFVSFSLIVPYRYQFQD